MHPTKGMLLAGGCLLLVSLSTSASATSILDFIYSDAAKQSPSSVESGEDEAEEDTCNCNGPNCNCCVDFNITFVDLGGPGCVNMRYLSQSEGLLVNVSYGDSLLHSEQVKGPDPKPTCMSLLGNLAKVCARFTQLDTHDDGLKGCLQLEPKLLGDIQTQFSVGCFIMGPEGMRLDPEMTAGDTNQTNTTETINTDVILTAVNESAQKGLAFFQDLLGFDASANQNSTDAANDDETDEENADSKTAR